MENLKRYEQIWLNPLFTYEGTWTNNNFTYNSDSRIKFNFTGTTLKIYRHRDSWASNRMAVYVDGVEYLAYNEVTGTEVLMLELTDLSDEEHSVIIDGKYSTSKTHFSVTVIEIDYDGEIKYYSENIQRMSKLSIHKTLKENLPLQIDNTKDEIHFTEDGQIYISKSDGTFKPCNTGDIIREVSNPLTTQPLEYGLFKCSSISSGRLIFDNIKGNILNENNSISLKSNKLYKLDMSLKATSAAGGGHTFNIVDELNNIIDKFETIVVNNNSNSLYSNSLSTFISLEKDSKIYIDTYNTTYSNVDITLTIHEIKNNPVSQYGGFETQILFDGNANQIGEYELSDDINNYDFLIIESWEWNDSEDITYALPIMTSNNTPVPLVATANSNYNSSYGIWKAFNRTRIDVYDCWLVSDASGWIKIDTGKQTECNGVYLAPRIDGAGNICNFTIQGSNDDVLWDNIKYESSSIPVSGKKYYFNGVASYRYYRIIGERYGSYIALSNFDLITGTDKNVTNTILNNPKTINVNRLKISDKTMLTFKNINFNVKSIDCNIYKITGYKGQLPSLLSGGEF